MDCVETIRVEFCETEWNAALTNHCFVRVFRRSIRRLPYTVIPMFVKAVVDGGGGGQSTQPRLVFDGARPKMKNDRVIHFSANMSAAHRVNTYVI